METYGHFFDADKLKIELQVCFSNAEINSTRKLCDALAFRKSSGLDGAMPQLYKLMSVFATIGATSAGAERSFSCLKRIKTCTRNAMGQERLTNLGPVSRKRR